MTLSPVQRGFVLTSVLLISRSAYCDGLLITCTAAEACDFKPVASININGREVIRSIAAKGVESVSVAALRATRERRIDGLSGIERDPTSNAVYSFSANGESRDLIFPGGSVPKEVAALPGIWATVRIGYRDSLKAKKDQSIATQSFAGYLIGRDLKDTAMVFARYLVSGSSQSAWRIGLLRGALRFGASAPSYKAWQDELFTSSRDALGQYRKQDGDPRRLGELLSVAIHDGEVLVQIAPSESTYSALLMDARREQELLKKKVAIAAALASAGFWDEYILKIQELRLVKWSLPNLVASERNALMDSAKAHRLSAEKMAQSGFLDRAFDEAERAYRRNPCSAEVAIYFNSIRPQFIERNEYPTQSSVSGPSRPELQQLERQLRSFDPSQLQQETYRKLGYDLIVRGDAIDRTYAPFQLAKAQFLRSLGRLSDALDVTINAERNLVLDARQRDEWLSLDANLSLALSATRDKSLADVKSNLEAGRFREALDATTPGLAADPNSPSLLIQRASAAASLRQPDEALHAIKTLLQSSNAACAEPGAFEKAFSLSDALGSKGGDVSPKDSEPVDGIANWISGKKYAPGKLYYDPVSLAFVPRLTFVSGGKNPATTTVFTWDGLRLVSIETTSAQSVSGKPNTPGQTTFFAEPEYAPGTLRMTTIGPRALQEGKRISYPLTFWNDPKVNVGLLQQSGRVAARGWWGNPVFDPFIWNGIYLFDFKYDEKGRVIEATPVADETRARSFAESLTFVWDDSTSRLKSVSSKSYKRVLEYDNKGRLLAEEATFRKSKARTSYQYAGDSFVPRRVTSGSVFDRQERTAVFQQGN